MSGKGVLQKILDMSRAARMRRAQAQDLENDAAESGLVELVDNLTR
jgi:hypothetical protein